MYVCLPYVQFQMKTAKMEQMDMDGALVEVDYVSQENKDIQKRRKFLFRVVLTNDIEYIMQAPNQNQRKTWYSLCVTWC